MKVIEYVFEDQNLIFKNTACNEVWKDIVGDETDDCFTDPSGNAESSMFYHVGALIQVHQIKASLCFVVQN